jgi:hypothetical protein
MAAASPLISHRPGPCACSVRAVQFSSSSVSTVSTVSTVSSVSSISCIPAHQSPSLVVNPRGIVICQAGRSGSQGRKGGKGKPKKAKGKPTKIRAVQLPSSMDDAVNQAALALRTSYKKACDGSSGARGMGESGGIVDRSIVTLYSIVPTNVQELRLAQDIASAFVGNLKTECCFVSDQADNGCITYDEACSSLGESTCMCYFCVAPQTRDVTKLEAFVKLLEEKQNEKGGRREKALVVVVNPEWAPTIGDGDSTSAIDSTAYCFFPILIKPLMMKNIEGIVYRNSALDGAAFSVEDKPWKVFVDRAEGKKLEMVGQMMVRPSSSDVESILYNAIAAQNSAQNKEMNPLKKLFG